MLFIVTFMNLKLSFWVKSQRLEKKKKRHRHEMEDRRHKAMEEDTGLQSSVHTGQSSLEVPAVLSCFVIFGFWFFRGRLAYLSPG